ncbi:uncharacterized protein LOC126846840 [Adelges cooleyi]|uniref:uncharacterized protein LOC126846840 n=1 Tax=Adelges cooleyi TaxID=133065 RepID=UPI0021802150|nr:uncharacterized protein LOC126846840 [Adelges cooleyi]
MIKLLVLSCLLAVATSAVSNIRPNLPVPAVPFYPQPYYPQANAVQPKYINAPPGVASAAAYVASPYYPGTYYRQAVYAPANPAYNPYYHGGYGVFPAYPQQYPYLPNDGASQGYGNSFTELMNYYLSNYGSYFQGFGGSSESPETQAGPQEASSVGAAGGAGVGEGQESGAEAGIGAGAGAGAGPEAGIVKVDKPSDEQKKEDQPAGVERPVPVPLRPFGTTSQLFYFGQPQFYGQAPFQQAAFYDPTRINSVNNGAISNFLFNRNQPQQAYQQPQQFVGQQFYPTSQPQPAPGSAALAYQRYLQYQKYQQAQPQSFQQQQQPFLQQQQQPFQQQQQQMQQQQPFLQQQQQQQSEQQSQDDSSVVVDSASHSENGDQQQAQPKLATDPTKAVAEPIGVAFAGTGGRAGAGPVGTAIVGNNATAIAEPKATAVSLDQTPTFSLMPVHKMTSAYVAKYSPELGTYKVSEIKRNLD